MSQSNEYLFTIKGKWVVSHSEDVLFNIDDIQMVKVMDTIYEDGNVKFYRYRVYFRHTDYVDVKGYGLFEAIAAIWATQYLS